MKVDEKEAMLHCKKCKTVTEHYETKKKWSYKCLSCGSVKTARPFIVKNTGRCQKGENI